MPVRRAHMATFPARMHVLEASLRSLAVQVDEIHLVLNEYGEVPGFLAGIRNVNPILPAEDFKDVGKFVARPGPDDHVFLVDDDLAYSSVYCDWLTRKAEEVGLERCVCGVHGGIYLESRGLSRPKTLHYRKGMRRSIVVDQIGTGTVLAQGRNVAPLEYMRGSQGFVDVRFARWCFESKIAQIALARPFNMVRPLRPGGPTLYRDFTLHDPPHVLSEIGLFAGRSPEVGMRVGQGIGLRELLFCGGAVAS